MENKKLIVFVCKGNIHRSALAEQVLKKIFKENNLDNQFEVISRGIQGSAGTKPTMYPNITKYDNWKFSRPSLEELGIDITKHVARPITREIADKADIIITFDKIILEENEAALAKQFPELRYKIHLLSELKGVTEDIQDCGDIQSENSHRIATRQIYDILTNYWRNLVKWAV